MVKLKMIFTMEGVIDNLVIRYICKKITSSNVYHCSLSVGILFIGIWSNISMTRHHTYLVTRIYCILLIKQ